MAELPMADVLFALRSAAVAVLLPPSSPILLLLAGLVWQRRHRRTGLGLVMVACVMLVLVSSTGWARFVQSSFQRVPAALGSDDLRHLAVDGRTRRDVAIVVLGGGLRPWSADYGAADLLPNGLTRLRYGLWLADQTGLPLGFCGGVPRDLEPGAPAEAHVADRIVRLEYRRSLRWLEDRSVDTRENARFMAPLLLQSGVRKVVLVTHAWHMPRALRAFRRSLGWGVELVAAPMGMATPAEGFDQWSSWMPSIEGLRQNRQTFRELLAWVAGH